MVLEQLVGHILVVVVGRILVEVVDHIPVGVVGHILVGVVDHILVVEHCILAGVPHILGVVLHIQPLELVEYLLGVEGMWQKQGLHKLGQVVLILDDQMEVRKNLME